AGSVHAGHDHASLVGSGCSRHSDSKLVAIGGAPSRMWCSHRNSLVLSHNSVRVAPDGLVSMIGPVPVGPAAVQYSLPACATRPVLPVGAVMAARANGRGLPSSITNNGARAVLHGSPAGFEPSTYSFEPSSAKP